MKLEKVGSLLKKFDVDIDSIKDDFEAAMEEEVDKVNKAIDIPLLTESMEEKIFTAFFNVLGGAIKKVLNKII